ncbi:hypothetical protein D9613_003521 [Agrocybe pediades]|uniref:Uncharacterized protein n=1 Tax=Agrocybe pediades TaxID=84607 RepID=A0A8H4QP82_9AGAR|nr:hypothetical protein D9613_003521 [Agrocybe pediades]
MSKTAIILFDVASLAGLVLLTAVFLTALVSSKAARTPTWFAFIGSSIALSVTNILIMRHQAGTEPSNWACFLQAVLIYPEVEHAYGRRAASASLPVNSIDSKIPGPTTKMPCMVTLILLVLSTIMAGLHPSAVKRDPSGMRCHLEETPNIVFYTTISLAILGVAIIVVFEVLVISKLLRNRQALKEGMIESKLSPAMVMRLTLFNACIFIAIIMSVFVFKDVLASASANNMAMAILPLAGGIIFGTQRDIFTVWVSLIRRKKKVNHSDVPIH